MSKNNNGGLLICGACAVSVNSSEPTSVEKLGRAIKRLFTRKAA